MNSKRICAVGMGSLLTLAGLFSMPVPAYAATTSTVTFRAGNVGTFDTSKITPIDGKLEVTENYLRFTVDKGDDLSGFFADDAALNSTLAYCLDVEENYFLKDCDAYGASVGTSNFHNTEYVLDYGVLVDGVSYTVYYVDSESGEQIAAPTIAYRNQGESVEVSPLSIAGYVTTDEPVTLTLSETGENEVTFHYTASEEQTTIVNTIVNTTATGQNAAAAGNAAGNAAAGGAGGNDGANADGADAQQVENIADEQTPLDAGANGEADNGETTIEDEDVPLQAGFAQNVKGYVVPIVVGVFAAALIIATVIWLYRKKKTAKVKTK